MTIPTAITRDWILAICEAHQVDEDAAVRIISDEIDKEAESEAARAFYCFPNTPQPLHGPQGQSSQGQVRLLVLNKHIPTRRANRDGGLRQWQSKQKKQCRGLSTDRRERAACLTFAGVAGSPERRRVGNAS